MKTWLWSPVLFTYQKRPRAMGVPWIAKNDDLGCVREPGPPAASPGGSREGIYIEKCEFY